MARVANEEGPHPLDVALGARVRQRRKMIGLSQSKLARSCGITFQQMQKYEHGTNRVSFSRLIEICAALKCSVSDLIGELDKKSSTGNFSRQVAHFAEPGALVLLQAYATLSVKHQRAILKLARQLTADKTEPKKSSHLSKRAA